MESEATVSPQDDINKILGQTTEPGPELISSQPVEGSNQSGERATAPKFEHHNYQPGTVAFEITNRPETPLSRQETPDTVTFNPTESSTSTE